MLYLKEINYEDLEKEFLFVRDMPIDENGMTNKWNGVNKDNTASLKVMLHNGGYIKYEDEEKYYVRIKKMTVYSCLKGLGYISNKGKIAATMLANSDGYFFLCSTLI